MQIGMPLLQFGSSKVGPPAVLQSTVCGWRAKSRGNMRICSRIGIGMRQKAGKARLGLVVLEVVFDLELGLVGDSLGQPLPVPPMHLVFTIANY